MSTSTSVGILSGLGVAQLGATPVAAAAGAMLRDLGATVKVFAGHAGPDGQRRGHERRVIEALQHGSEVVTVDDLFADATLRAAASSAELVVCDLSAAPEVATPGFIDAYEAAVARRNASAWVTVSAFGLHGERRRYRATELTALAAGGIAFSMRESEGRPIKPAGYTASIAAGHVAAVAGLHGLHARRIGPPLHLDVSMQDTVIATGVFLECAHALFECPGRGGMGRYAAPRGYFPCRDGHLFVVVLEDHQWAGLVTALGNRSWARGIVSNADRMANAERIEAELRQWTGCHSAADAAEVLQRHGVPASPMNSCAALLDDADFLAQDFLRANDDGTVLPGLPALLADRVAPVADLDIAAAPTTPIRVLDVGNVLAGPLATSWLGTMGVDVLKIEDPSRLDIYRRRGPFIAGVEGVEHGAYFAAANYSKRSRQLALDVAADAATFAELVATSDFVVENLSLNRAQRVGLGPTAALRRATTVLSSSGFGRESSKGHYRAYGQIIHSYGGITYETRDSNGQFVALGTSWADPLTSTWICALVLSQALRQRDERAHVDLSMVKVVGRQLPDYFAAASKGEVIGSAANRLEGYSPHGIYRCAGDDRWLAVAIGDDDEWQRFVDVIADARLDSNEALATHQARLADQDRVDATVAEVLARRDPDELFDRLQEAGVACSPVLSAAMLARSDHLRTRGLIQVVSHPVWGEREVTGLPWRVVDRGPLTVRPTPVLGDADAGAD